MAGAPRTITNPLAGEGCFHVKRGAQCIRPSNAHRTGRVLRATAPSYLLDQIDLDQRVFTSRPVVPMVVRGVAGP